ncbi:EAL and GGDEF domain-containing protein [Hylemonella gracilis]|uniref:sensor domain-containing protein n=1 Tax=Hylemonella gracilis TaxID=80880 RepID=UPI0006842D8D|nr:EAL domain-containing protein [Hylemonella gracilis]
MTAFNDGKARDPGGGLCDDGSAKQDSLFQAVFDGSPGAIALIRQEDGCLVRVNHEWLELTGYAHEELQGRTLVDIGCWVDAADCGDCLAEVGAQGRLRGRESWVWFKDRQRGRRLVRLNGSLLESALAPGGPYVLLYMEDITATRMAEEALREGEAARTRANDRLAAQLELYALTEELARVGHWSSDGKTVHFSPGLQKMAGTQTPAVLTVEEARRRIHPEDFQNYMAAREAMDGRVFEYRIMGLDGNMSWRRSRIHRHRNSDGSYLDFGVILDVTAETEAALVLRQQLAFIEKITSHVPLVLFLYERRTDGTEVFPFLSPGVRQLFGVEAEAARRDARLLFDRLHPEDRAEVRRSMDAAHFDGGIWSHEFRILGDDGWERWLLGHAIHRMEGEQLVAYGSISDITDRKLAEQRLQDSEARFRSLTDLSSDWYWETDEQLRFIHFVGYQQNKILRTEAEILGKTRWEIGALNMTEEDWAAHRRVLESRQPFRDLELLRIGAYGQQYWVSISGAPIFDTRQRFRGYRGIGRDISDRKRAEGETQRLAFYDTLTGLPNRRLLLDRLAQAQAACTRSKRHGALFFLDLDNFKDLNDTLGHDVGDLLLKQVAQRLLSCLRESDTAARLGGDEFVVMLLELAEDENEAAAHAEQVGEKILKRLNAPYELAGRQHSSSPSIGLTVFSGGTQGVDELLKRADLAMYQAKAAGRNTLRFFDPQMQAAVLARAALDADMRLAVQNDELLLHYQPVVDAAGGVQGYEALLRWNHPRRGLLAPGSFIGLAEQSGLILSIGEWVLRAACRQLVLWGRGAATQGLTVAVNVSARQFRQRDFVDQVLTVIEETGVDPQRLRLELTESLLISEVEDAIRKMAELRARGVRFSLDDFGTGYSSLNYLKRLPLDSLKIDRSFVNDVLTDPNDAVIVRTILALARSMGLQTVAEGVETEGQRDFLRDNGCTLFQGYLFGRPGLPEH